MELQQIGNTHSAFVFLLLQKRIFEFLSYIHLETLRDIWSNAILKTTYISWCSDDAYTMDRFMEAMWEL